MHQSPEKPSLGSSQYDKFQSSSISRGFFVEDEHNFIEQIQKHQEYLQSKGQSASKVIDTSSLKSIRHKRTTTESQYPVQDDNLRPIQQRTPKTRRRNKNQALSKGLNMSVQKLDDNELIMHDRMVFGGKNKESGKVEQSQQLQAPNILVQQKKYNPNIFDQQVMQSPPQNSISQQPEEIPNLDWQQSSPEQQRSDYKQRQTREQGQPSANEPQKINSENHEQKETRQPQEGHSEKLQQGKREKSVLTQMKKCVISSSLMDNTKVLGNRQSAQYRHRMITGEVGANCIMAMKIERESGFLSIWPQFKVSLQNDNCHIMTAKRVSKTPYSTYILSTNQNYQESSPFYIGKAKSSVLGDQLDIFGPGLSPQKALELGLRPRQFLATVLYQKRIFKPGQPRDFKVYLKKANADYYEDFPEVKPHGQQIPLNLLYQNPHNRDKIIVLRNRKPRFIKQLNGFALKFRNRVTVSSSKNFILQIQPMEQKNRSYNQQLEEVLLFGKFQDQKFRFDVSPPLSPDIAFGIVLSSFDEKYFCE